jgi:hypothetical protein
MRIANYTLIFFIFFPPNIFAELYLPKISGPSVPFTSFPGPEKAKGRGSPERVPWPSVYLISLALFFLQFAQTVGRRLMFSFLAENKPYQFAPFALPAQ